MSEKNQILSRQSKQKSEPFNYDLAVERAFNWYDENIAFRTDNTCVELVTLTGKYAGKIAVKIPMERDDRDGVFRRRVEAYFDISIRKWVFKSEYSMPRPDGRRERIFYNTYLYKQVAHD